VPINIQDIVSRLKDNNLSTNERMVLIQRLEAVKQYCTDALNKHNYVDLGQVYAGRK
jgi:hypothetical protein